MKIAAIFFTLLISFSAHGINYYRCDKTEDCAKAYGGCGRYFSVHRRYKELYEAKAHKGDKTVNCLAPTEMDKKYKFDGQPLCKKNKCLLVLPKKEEAKQ